MTLLRDRGAARGRLLTAVVAAAIVCLAAATAYLPTLRSYFLADDFGYVQLYWDQPLSAFPRLFAADWSQGIWDQPLDELRPLVALSFRLNTLLSGLNPIGYHLFNLLTHVAASLLVLAVARRLIGATWPAAAAAAALFGVLPVHAELVGWISGRVDVMTTAFVLTMLLGYGLATMEGSRAQAERDGVGRRRGRVGWYLLAVVALALALFTKEAALSAILLLPAWDLYAGGLSPERRPHVSAGGWPRAAAAALARYLPFLAVLGVYLIDRSATFPQPVRAQVFTPERLAEFASRQGFYLASLGLPSTAPLSPPGEGDVATAGVLFGALWLLALIATALWGLLGRRRLSRMMRLAIYFGPVWYLVTTLPLIVTYASSRHLYLPSAGLCLAVACLLPFGGLVRRPIGWRGLAWALMALVLIGGWSALLLRELRGAELANASRSIHEAVLASAERLPAGSRLVIVPAVSQGEDMLWRWALPFALQPPFAPTDLYQRFDIIELSDAYCCPEWTWWGRRGQRIHAWLFDETTPTTLLQWDPAQRRMIERPLTTDEVYARLEQLRGGGEGDITGQEALRLINSFALGPAVD